MRKCSQMFIYFFFCFFYLVNVFFWFYTFVDLLFVLIFSVCSERTIFSRERSINSVIYVCQLRVSRIVIRMGKNRYSTEEKYFTLRTLLLRFFLQQQIINLAFGAFQKCKPVNFVSETSKRCTIILCSKNIVIGSLTITTPSKV